MDLFDSMKTTITSSKSIITVDLTTTPEDSTTTMKPLHKHTKPELLGLLHSLYRTTYIDWVEQPSANNVDLVSVGRNMCSQFDKELGPWLSQINTVIIENQISPIANRMKTIQGLITQYFIMRTESKISYVSSANKLKDVSQDQKSTYKERKKTGLTVCETHLHSQPNGERWVSFFKTHKKKDDLADAFLQGIWFISSQVQKRQ